MTCCNVFCRRPVMECFVADLLLRVFLSSTIGSSWVFVLAIHMAKFDPIESSYQILFIGMLQIWTFRYSKHFWIIKFVDLEPILFSINLDVASSFKVFNTFDFVFSIDCITNLNQ